MQVKFGREMLRLESWFICLQYQWFCKQLGSGMNLHLASNYMLRWEIILAMMMIMTLVGADYLGYYDDHD